MSVITYFRQTGPEAVAELRRLAAEQPLKALEYADGLPGVHTDRAWAGLHDAAAAGEQVVAWRG
ncbi:hypothetical protein [Actinoplanes sp. CA-252034]|uniref:hypothetical protein n=1 Tax=Actinoplanes sp. CA-252034 TaxID=3239906 RepID=UPI003D95D927